MKKEMNYRVRDLTIDEITRVLVSLDYELKRLTENRDGATVGHNGFWQERINQTETTIGAFEAATYLVSKVSR